MKSHISDRPYKKYVFVDRDGVINVERGDYTTTTDQWEWATGALDGIRVLTENGIGVVVITNQACISKGLQTEEGLLMLHDFMVDTVRKHGGDIAAVYYCPHWTMDNCDCRKPKPGLFFEAAGDMSIELGSAFFIGDALRDMEAGNRAGVKTIFIEGSKASNGHTNIKRDFSASDLLVAAKIVIKN